MKIKNIVLIVLLFIIVIATLAVKWNADYEVEESNKTNTIKEEKNNNSVSYEKIKQEYEENFKAINNNEKIKDLSGENINKDYIILKAKEAKSNVLDIENNTDKIVTIQRIVYLDDLAHNTSRETIIDVLDYIINEYENNKLRDNDTIQYLYVTSFLIEAIKQYNDLGFSEDMLLDMNSICKDTIRQLDLKIIQSNVDQVNKVIDNVKEKLNENK